MKNKLPFLLGLFFITMSTLLQEVLNTRLLSVLTWYHFSFFAISLAMFGLAAGAVRVYLGGAAFEGDGARLSIGRYSRLYALSIPVCHIFILHMPIELNAIDSEPFVVLTTISVVALTLSLPFFLGGIVVTLALTRMPGRIGVIYAFDLVGAALGCLLMVPLLGWTDISSAVLVTAALAQVGASFLQELGAPRLKARVGAVALVAALVGLAVWNGSSPAGIRILYAKGSKVDRQSVASELWNSHSQVLVQRPTRRPMQYWSSLRGTPPTNGNQMRVVFDGSAVTYITEWNGQRSSLEWTKHDLTAIPFHLRRNGSVAVIGFGGGRDLLAGLWSGARSVVGIEVNGILIDLLRRKHRDFARLATEPAVRLVHDDARSYLTRSPEKYDVLQMSLIDSWAATSAGALSLAENGLYTREAWRVFLRTLKPNGIFAVSRWHTDKPRLISLATAAVHDLGSARPAAHILFLGRGPVATLMVSRSAYAAEDLRSIRELARRHDFQILIAPDEPASDPLLRRIVDSRTEGELAAATVDDRLDLSPPTDRRPYFFNVVKPSAFFGGRLKTTGSSGFSWNLLATTSLMMLLGVSLGLVLVMIIGPLILANRPVGDRRAFFWGLLYFSLIGGGFMMVQIPYMQRFSVFLGHPSYAIIVILFSMILFAGLGSLTSERLPVERMRWVHLVVPLAIAATILVVVGTLQPMFDATISLGLVWRCLIVVLYVAPLALIMGFCFPLGMRLLGRITDRCTPWMFGVNGAFGVLASVITVALSMWVGIHTSLLVAALLYALLLLPAHFLWRRGQERTGDPL